MSRFRLIAAAWFAVAGFAPGGVGGGGRTAPAATLEPPRVVHADSLGAHIKPDVAAMAGGGEVCVWSGPAGIHWARSGDGGESWPDGGAGLDRGGSMADRPRVVVLPGDSLVVCAWDELGTAGSRRIRAALSWDHGRSFGAPVEVSGEYGHNLGVALAAGRGGRVVAVWMRRVDLDFDIVAALSLDRGVHWSAPILVSGEDATDQFAPAVAMTRRGRTYIAWESYDDLGGDADVLLVRSDDFGRSFTAETRVHPTLLGNQWSPTIAADDSLVWVAYVDDRIGDDDLFVSTSHDAGATWEALPYPLGGPGHGLQWNPRLVRNGPRRALLVWEVLDSNNDFSVQLAESADGGESWSMPQLVAAVGRTPSVALAGDGYLCVVWSGAPATETWLIWGAPGSSFPALPAARQTRLP